MERALPVIEMETLKVWANTLGKRAYGFHIAKFSCVPTEETIC